MPETIYVIESHHLVGKYPKVDTYKSVDVDMLHEGDDNPFYLTLPVAEVGRVSANGLFYDEALVSRIEEQLEGSTGIRGHLSADDVSTKYPVSAIYWVGHKRQGNKLWAKGYIPPGETRNDVRIRKAANGRVGTSIFGKAVKEMRTSTRRQWFAKNFKLETLDLVEASRESLQMGGEFTITSEMENQEGKEMSEQTTGVITSVSQVPAHILDQYRGQIVQELQLQNEAGRVSELETQVSEQEEQLAEMRQYATIVTELRSTLGSEANIPAIVKELHETVNSVKGVLGENVNISMRVEELHKRVAVAEAEARNNEIDTAIAELTKWNVTDDAHIKQLDALRTQVRNRVNAELKDDSVISEAVKTVWDSEFSLLAEALVKSLSGGPAIAGAVNNQSNATNWKEEWVSEDGRKATKEKWGV